MPCQYWVSPKFPAVFLGAGTRLFRLANVPGGTADKRSQSTPATSQRHSSGVTEKQLSVAFGQIKPPRCKRRWHSQTPLPSHSNSFRRLPARLRNTNAEPAHGGCPNACWTMADRPSGRQRPCACPRATPPAKCAAGMESAQASPKLRQPSRRYARRQLELVAARVPQHQRFGCRHLDLYRNECRRWWRYRLPTAIFTQTCPKGFGV